MLALRHKFEGCRVSGGRLSDAILFTKRQEGGYGPSRHHLGRRLRKASGMDSSISNDLAATRRSQ